MPDQAVLERAVVLGYGANAAVASPALASLVNEYSALLASQARSHPSCGGCALLSTPYDAYIPSALSG